MSRLVTADGVGLHYRVAGPEDALPIVLVNSLGCDLRMWEAQVPVLKDRWRVVRYDARGHGHSDVPDGEYTLDQLGQDLLALLDGLGIARAHVCGVSLGGLTALWLAIRAPERVASLALLNTAARIGTVEGWTGRMETIRAGGMAAVRNSVVGRFLSADFRAKNPEVERQVSAMLLGTPVEGYVGACAALRDADLRLEVKAIRLPTLIVAGEGDQATPPEDARTLQEAIAGSELLLLEDAAHLSNVERAEDVNRALCAFLEPRRI